MNEMRLEQKQIGKNLSLTERRKSCLNLNGMRQKVCWMKWH